MQPLPWPALRLVPASQSSPTPPRLPLAWMVRPCAHRGDRGLPPCHAGPGHRPAAVDRRRAEQAAPRGVCHTVARPPGDGHPGVEPTAIRQPDCAPLPCPRAQAGARSTSDLPVSPVALPAGPPRSPSASNPALPTPTGAPYALARRRCHPLATWLLPQPGRCGHASVRPCHRPPAAVQAVSRCPEPRSPRHGALHRLRPAPHASSLPCPLRRCWRSPVLGSSASPPWRRRQPPSSLAHSGSGRHGECPVHSQLRLASATPGPHDRHSDAPDRGSPKRSAPWQAIHARSPTAGRSLDHRIFPGHGRSESPRQASARRPGTPPPTGSAPHRSSAVLPTSCPPRAPPASTAVPYSWPLPAPNLPTRALPRRTADAPRPPAEGRGPRSRAPATSYSPRGSLPKYHRRWWA
jgi:hypothetical protein